ncbi:hypothetical protein [Jeotgalibacillus malaysiensis]|uniref:hypothetical protein n=1 Tax=Jeotgalibacillus malaysiensis TaxID=1508404 RepID=UPI00384F432E
MSKKDHVFMVNVNCKIWWIFCKFKDISKIEAYQRVEKVLIDKKNLNSYDLYYLGNLNYEDMDPEVANLLPLYEKYETVWILTDHPTVSQENDS